MKKLLAAALLVLPVWSAVAQPAPQAYPARMVRWVVPYPAGGGADFIARTISQPWAAAAGQQIVVENKPGGSTAIGASDVVRAPADGYTVLTADNGTLVFNPALYKSLSYSPSKDLAPVTLMGRFPMILIVNPGVAAKDAMDFIAQAKARPGDLSFGSAGAGSPHHLAMELLQSEAGIRMLHVPYRGAAPALADVAGGQVPAMMVDLAAGAAFIKGGKVRALAVANATRLPQLPEVPTFAELGIKNVEAAALVGLAVRAGTPGATIEAINKQVVAAINEPAVRQRLVEFGFEPVGNTPEQFAALLKSETEKWHKLIRDLNISLD
jgi:tripartite-type tricarboxylate transporter receptor subunit TctC